MPKSMKKRSQKAGLPPGSLVYTGDRTEVKTRITIVEYDEGEVHSREIASLSECPIMIERPGVTWIDVSGISHVGHLEHLGECFKLHPLVLEDILNVDQRPKVEDYEDYLFIVIKAISTGSEINEIAAEQISLILGCNYVLSFHENSEDLFEVIRERLVAAKGRIRKAGADYLAYSLMDLIVDNYFVTLEQFGEQVEFMEDEVVSRAVPATLQTIHHLKNDMIILRRSLWPLREVIARLERRESPLINEPTSVYFKDVYDHTIIAIDTVETYRDILSGLLDIYLSSVSNRLNEIMKVLTIFASIFMPLTFLAGIYGMNFTYMPELKWHYAYFGLWAIMILLAGSMVRYFKKKKWI
ncbi:MAG: magnesium/cobalt transporter CorA [Deltaproteobacteria bacterium]|nr:magnesium/cobalt transporter CorA [Deltaproteobacteria bacterium]